jgi:hypothetical protein
VVRQAHHPERSRRGIQKTKLDAPGLLIAGAGLFVIPDLIRDRHDIDTPLLAAGRFICCLVS